MKDLQEFELVFPCEYPVRVIGEDVDGFEEFVIQAVSRHVPDLERDSFSSRKSRENRYLSVSVTFIAESRAQVTALYQELGADPRVKVAL